MNPSLQRLLALADEQHISYRNERTQFQVWKDGYLVLAGYFLSYDSRNRQAFGQATGKLLNAGFTITTFKEKQ